MYSDDKLMDKIDEGAKLSKKLIADTAPYRYLISEYFQLLKLQKKHEREIKVLVTKMMTMGLTYFERERLKFLSPR
jgi:hypothetical protein